MTSYEGYTFVEESDGIAHYRMHVNGLDVLLAPLVLAPVTVFMITYRVGSRNESTGLTGATHFLEHLMFKGTRRFSKETGTSVFNVLQQHGARVNATTWLDRTNYYELLPSDNLELAIEIEADRMRGARLDPGDVESERTVILNELDRGENEPLRKLYQSVWSAAFVAHPYRHPTIGWRSDVQNISSEALRRFYDTFYWPDNATVTVIGDYNDNAAMAALRRHFATIPSATDPLPEVHTEEPVQLGERHVTVRMAGDLGSVMIAFKSPAAADESTAALGLLASILGDGKTGRLYRLLVDTGLATAVSASPSVLRDPGLFYIYAMLAPGRNHEEVKHKILGAIEKVTVDLVTLDELDRAKALLHADTAFDRDGAFSMASGINEAIAAGDWKLYGRIPEMMETVTAEEVRDAAAKIFDVDRMTVGYFDPV